MAPDLCVEARGLDDLDDEVHRLLQHFATLGRKKILLFPETWTKK